MQASLNSVLTSMQDATCTNVGVAVVNTPAVPPGQQLPVATFGMPESPPEQPVQTRQKHMHTEMAMEVATGTNVGVTAVNTHAIPPGHQLLRQTAVYVAPESPAEQPVQTRQEPMHTDMSAAPDKSVNTHEITPKHQMVTRRGAARMAQERPSNQAVLGQRMSIRQGSACTT